MGDDQVLATFFGDDEFPIEWEDGQRELFWVHDDLHIPNPVSPMYADIGGWWLKCDYMFRRFGTPFASDWIVKIINGYVYTAAIPAQSGLSAEASEYGSRYTPRVPLDPKDPDELGHYMGWTLPYYAEHFLDWWRGRLRRWSTTSSASTSTTTTRPAWSSSRSCSRTRSTCTTGTGRSTGC
jgi:hypothetical protein